MPGRPFHWAVLCCIGSLLPVSASGQVRSHTSLQPRAAADRLHYVAVMGEVKSGGVLAFSSDSPTLRELIRSSGGLTPQAGDNVRILRNGRTTLTVHAVSGLAMRLRSGDVVLVSKTTQQGLRVARRGKSGEITGTLVEVTLLNLIQRPVVLRLRPRHANLPTLLRLLGQAPDIAPSVRIIGSGVRRVSLKSGSVLVFDPRLVQLSRIPPLPQPVFPQVSSAVNSNGNVARSISQRTGDSIRLAQATSENPVSTSRADMRILTTVPPPELRGNAGQSTTDRQSRFKPPPGEPAPSSPVRVAENTAAAGNDTKPNRASVPSPDGVSTPANDGDLVRKADQSEESGEKSAGLDVVTLTIMVFAAFGVLGVAGLLVSIGRRAVRSRSKSENSPARHRSRLDQLIKNEIPLVEESVAIPTGQTFFGQSAGPQRLRVDEEHATGYLFQPHISGRSKPTSVKEEGRPGQGVQRTDGPEALNRPSETKRAGQPTERTKMRTHAPPAHAPRDPSGHSSDVSVPKNSFSDQVNQVSPAQGEDR